MTALQGAILTVVPLDKARAKLVVVWDLTEAHSSNFGVDMPHKSQMCLE